MLDSDNDGVIDEKESDVIENILNLNNIKVGEILTPRSVVFALNESMTIKEIIEKFEVSIDIDREKGKVKVSGKNKPKVVAACEHIKNIAHSNRSYEIPKYQSGEILKGKVKKITSFGAFVSLKDGIDGLIHISKLSENRVEKVEDVLKEGDEVEIEVLSQKGHKIELSLKQIL